MDTLATEKPRGKKTVRYHSASQKAPGAGVSDSNYGVLDSVRPHCQVVRAKRQGVETTNAVLDRRGTESAGIG